MKQNSLARKSGDKLHAQNKKLFAATVGAVRNGCICLGGDLVLTLGGKENYV